MQKNHHRAVNAAHKDISPNQMDVNQIRNKQIIPKLFFGAEECFNNIKHYTCYHKPKIIRHIG